MKQAINTRTQEEYDALMRYYEEKGVNYLFLHDENFWANCGEQTCVIIGEDGYLEYSPAYFYKANGYTIIPYTEFAKTIKPEIDYKAKFEEAVKLLGDCLSISSVYEKDNYLLEEINQFLTNHKDGE